jgi:hypothetical protein
VFCKEHEEMKIGTFKFDREYKAMLHLYSSSAETSEWPHSYEKKDLWGHFNFRNSQAHPHEFVILTYGIKGLKNSQFQLHEFTIISS